MATIKVIKKPFPEAVASAVFTVEFPMDSTPFAVTSGFDKVNNYELVNLWYIATKRVQIEKFKFTIAKQDATIEGTNPGQYIGQFFAHKKFYHVWVELTNE